MSPYTERFDTATTPQERQSAQEADWDTVTDLIFLRGEFGVEGLKTFIAPLETLRSDYDG